jgi:hypothetical protein
MVNEQKSPEKKIDRRKLVTHERDLKTGRWLPKNVGAQTHGLKLYEKMGRLPAYTPRRRIQAALSALRVRLIEAVPGSDDPRRLLLIDQVVRTEGHLLIIDSYLKRVGPVRADRLKKRRVEAQPVLENFVPRMLVIQRAALQALGLGQKEFERIKPAYEIMAEADHDHHSGD